jgi:hypothetical protein
MAGIPVIDFDVLLLVALKAGMFIVTTRPTLVAVAVTVGAVVHPVNVAVQVPSSYQFSNWLVIPAAGVLAVKLTPLAAVPGIKLPVDKVTSPDNVGAADSTVLPVPVLVVTPVPPLTTGKTPVILLALITEFATFNMVLPNRKQLQ